MGGRVTKDGAGVGADGGKEDEQVEEKPEPLMNAARLCPGLKVDLRYATADNFTGEQLYPDESAKCCFLRESVARRLCSAQEHMEQQGYGLLVWDAYRPLSVQSHMWELVPDSRYVARTPQAGGRGSNHNRGAAVDVTIVDSSGQPVEMGSGFDDFTVRAHHDYKKLPPNVLKNREWLKDVMGHNGFRALKEEWWHYDAVDCKSFGLLDIPFEKLCHSILDGG